MITRPSFYCLTKCSLSSIKGDPSFGRMPSPSPIKRWVTLYTQYGVDGLKRKETKESYSVPFKLDVLQFMKRTGTSYRKTAHFFGIREVSIIANWNRAFQEKEIEGLKSKPKGRPSMFKQSKNKKMNRTKKCQERKNWSAKRSFSVWRILI